MSIGSKILELRMKKNISQEKLADELKVSRQSISKWETDQSIPDLDKIQMLSQFFNVSVDSLVNDDEELIYDEVENNDNQFTKINNFKRVAIILFKTTIIMAICYFVLFMLSITFQKLILQVYGVETETFIYPILLIFDVIIYTFCYIFFPIKIIEKLNKKGSQVTLEIVALAITVVVLSIISYYIDLVDIASVVNIKDQIYIMSYSTLKSYMNRLSLINIIPNALFIIGATISLVTKKIDEKAYITPKLKEYEEVGTGFKVLSFFMGFLGLLIGWVLSFVLMSEWKHDQPVRRKEFIKYFIIGIIVFAVVSSISFVFMITLNS